MLTASHGATSLDKRGFQRRGEQNLPKPSLQHSGKRRVAGEVDERGEVRRPVRAAAAAAASS